MWEFRHGSTPMMASIADKDWLKTYQSRMVSILPQDSVKAIVKVIRKYDSDKELIGEHFSLTKIIEVISGPEQPNMFSKQ